MLVKILPIKARVGLAIGLMSVLALQGCASSSAMQQNVNQNTGQTQQRIEALQAQQQQAEQRQRAAASVRADTPWVATQRVPFQMQLPARFNEQIVVNEPTPVSMRLLLGRISEMTGMRFTVDNDVFETRSRGAGGGAGGAGAARGDAAAHSAESRVCDGGAA